MANTIKIKNSGTASNTPSANSLEYGELAINYVDGKLYFKNTASTVNFFSAGAGGGASTLDDLTDVTITSATSGDFLKYNGSVWINDPINLGTDTTGNYMTDVSAGTGISITHTPAEGSTATIAVDTSYSGFVPTGTVFQYSGNTAPSGYLICDGAAISRTTYATLFGVIGTRYGVGDGTTTFNLPSMATKVPQGITTGLPSGTTLATGAQSADHTHTITTGGQSADHTHNGTSGNQSADHSHNGTSGNASANHSHNSNWTVGTGNDSVNHTHSYQKSNGSNSAATSGGIDNSHTHTWNANLTTGGDGASHTHNTTTGGMSANHTHNTTTGGVSAGHTHSGTTAGVSAGHTHSFDIVQFVYIIKI